MSEGTVLLVHDDIATIAAVRRLLQRAGHDMVLASSVSDAVAAYLQERPALVVVSPGVEEDRGHEVVEELSRLPDAAALRLMILGSPLPDLDVPNVPLPLDGKVFLERVGQALGTLPDLERPLPNRILGLLRPKSATPSPFKPGKNTKTAKQKTPNPVTSRVAPEPITAEASPPQWMGQGSVDAPVEPAPPPPAHSLVSFLADGDEDNWSLTQEEDLPLKGPREGLAAKLTLSDRALAAGFDFNEAGALNDAGATEAEGEDEPFGSENSDVRNNASAATVKALAPSAPAETAPRPPTKSEPTRARPPALHNPFDATLGAGRAPIPSQARLGLEELCRVGLKLARGGATGELELSSEGAMRTVWLVEGEIYAAVSNVGSESLLERAHRDGLLDGEQVRELRLNAASADGDILGTLLERGYVREAEAVPLLQRYTEQIVLEGLSEPSTQYRWRVHQRPEGVQRVTPPRGLPALVTEALRRGITAEAAAVRTHGLSTLPRLLGPVAKEQLGWTERELRILSAVDGRSTIRDLLLEAGVSQDVAVRTLAVAEALGVVELVPQGPEKVPVFDAELEAQRLEAKWKDAEEADYFRVLGLSRTAGSEEVARAFERLSSEFSPLRFVGHPDAGLQRTAQQLHDLLAEAAQALSNDALRASYARNLAE